MSASIEIQKMMAESEATGSSLTAPAVVEAAKDVEKWPGLNQYLWQTPEPDLAMEARLQRVHRLMIQLHITTEEGIKTRLAVHTGAYEGYRPLSAVSTNKDFAAAKLAELTQDIGRARARLRAFRAALSSEIADEIDNSLQRAEDAATEAAQTRAEV